MARKYRGEEAEIIPAAEAASIKAAYEVRFAKCRTEAELEAEFMTEAPTELPAYQHYTAAFRRDLDSEGWQSETSLVHFTAKLGTSEKVACGLAWDAFHARYNRTAASGWKLQSVVLDV